MAPKLIAAGVPLQTPLREGAYDAPPDLLVGWGGEHPLPIPLPSTPLTATVRRL